MFSNNRKTIGVFAENVGAEFQNDLCQGIAARAKELGYNVAVFTPFGNYGQNTKYYKGDRQLYELPEYEEFDGVIMALDTMGDPESRKAVLTQVRERCRCPVVSVREVISGANNLLVDNTTCMEGILRHFIEEHGFTRICFMTGPADHWDAQERLNCFKREMAQHELPVEDHQIFYGDFWKNKGKEACDWFLDVEQEERPQVIICANDYMALSVASELIDRGYRIPEDICVSGYDGLQDTLNFTPSVTTMAVPFKKMGRKAIDIIDEKQDMPDKAEDYYFEVEVIRRESCGCVRGNKEEIVQTRRRWYEQIKEDQNREMQFCFMSINLGEFKTVEDIADRLSYFVYDVEGYDRYCLCLCESLEDKKEYAGYSDTMELRVFADRNGNGEDCAPFRREELLPAGVSGEEPQIWYFCPVHYEDYCYGYEAFRFQDEKTTGKLYLQWNTNIGNKIRDILNRNKMQGLIAQLEEMYDRDALTGLYNRHGMYKYGTEMVQRAAEREKPLFVASIDLDDMKYINDNFGHVEGDFAIKTIAQLLREVSPENGIAVRSGGDEYILMAEKLTDEQAANLFINFEKKISIFNGNGQKPYEIHASVGYVNRVPDPDESMERFIQESDAKMYQGKKEYKKKRGGIVR